MGFSFKKLIIKGIREFILDHSGWIYNWQSLLEILDVLEKQPKKLSEIKGKVISDYQNYLEKKWLDELRNKYSVTINNDVLYSLIK